MENKLVIVDSRTLGKTLRSLGQQLGDVFDPPATSTTNGESNAPSGNTGGASGQNGQASTPAPAVVLPVGGATRTDLKLVFEDQFDKVSGNWRAGSRDKASGLQASPGYPNLEAEFYHPEQLTIASSQMQLEAKNRWVKIVKVAPNAATQGTFVRKSGTQTDPDLFYWPYYEGLLPWQSAWASTGPDDNGWTSTPMWQPSGSLKEWRYGWLEASIKQPKGPGFWTAMWMLRSDRANAQEIDIFEMVDPASKKIALHYHPAGGGDWTKEEGPGHDTGVDLSAGFHTYAVDWQPEYIRWYLDGKLLQERTKADGDIPDAPMYLMFNFAVGAKGSWPGAPTSATPASAKMLVDYVRVWQ